MRGYAAGVASGHNNRFPRIWCCQWRYTDQSQLTNFHVLAVRQACYWWQAHTALCGMVEQLPNAPRGVSSPLSPHSKGTSHTGILLCCLTGLTLALAADFVAPGGVHGGYKCQPAPHALLRNVPACLKECARLCSNHADCTFFNHVSDTCMCYLYKLEPAALAKSEVARCYMRGKRSCCGYGAHPAVV